MTGQDTSLSVYEQLEELLAQGPYELISLTDEELVAVDQQPDEGRLAVTPYLDAFEDEQARQVAIACGMRSMVSRGAVSVDDTEELRRRVQAASRKGAEGVSFDLRYAPDLDLALNLRATADKIVVVEQLSAEVRDWHYVYAHGGRFCLQEAVSAVGQRTYTLLEPAESRRQLVALADPLGNAGQDSEPQLMDANEVASGQTGPLAEALEKSRLVSQVMELHPDAETPQGRLSVIYLTDDALWVVESDPSTGSETVAARTLSPEGLVQLIDRALSA